ncbi:MAG: hypothetical protein K6G91_08850 [Kiritimatiellae bacterium]|nr:hypothetical protein [Kiritimatiellia bacterium]
MKTNAYLTFLAVLSACAALSAADFSYEGRWQRLGTPVTSEDTTCEVRFYSSADAADAEATFDGVPLRTDSDGYFVISTNSPASLPDTFWVGVKPEGANEISPRFRVAPVPFALASAEAAIVTNDSVISISGTAQIERLDVSGDVVVKECVVKAGGTMSGNNVQVPSVTLTGLTLATSESMLGLFESQSSFMNLDYDSFPAEHWLETATDVSVHWPILRTVDSRTTERFTSLMPFDTDGFLVAELRSEVGAKCPLPRVTLTVGPTKFLDNVEIGEADTTVSRIMSIPCRRGETTSITVKAIGAGSTVSYYDKSRYSSMIGVKLRFVRIGRY